jgi:hypothetical protein
LNVFLSESKYDILGSKKVGFVSIISCANTPFENRKPAASTIKFFIYLYVFSP